MAHAPLLLLRGLARRENIRFKPPSRRNRENLHRKTYLGAFFKKKTETMNIISYADR
jgi:hypothetical protein